MLPRHRQATETVERQMRELGLPPGACLACREAKCKWKPYIDFEHFTERTKALIHELEIARVCQVGLPALSGHAAPRMRPLALVL